MGYVLQFIALGHGPIVVVQPLLVCGLLFALPLGAAWAGRKLRRTGLDRGRAGVLPAWRCSCWWRRLQSGHDNVGPIVWVALLGSAAAVVLVLVAVSLGGSSWQRAVLLSGGGGRHLRRHGRPDQDQLTPARPRHQCLCSGTGSPTPSSIAGVVGMVIGQSAFQAGSLDASLPTMSVVDPIVSIVIGALAFGESIAAGPGDVLVEVIALAAMSAGVVLLARSAADRSLHPSPPALT